MTISDPTKRFTTRAVNYARNRPGYPPAVLDCLREECGLTPDTIVADIGSGTGILTALFLENGNQVYAVEPNEAMRQQAEEALGKNPKFISIDGRAEATTLADGSVDLITAGQAFHWFDAAASRIKFGRILSPDGFVALVWNVRAYQDDPLMVAYEQVLASYGMGYHTVTHRAHAGAIETLFANGNQVRSFAYSRLLDFETLWGGFLSASYAPQSNDPRYEPMREALRQMFEAHQRDGYVTFRYNTQLHFGRL